MDHPTVWGGNFIPGSRQLFEAMTFYDLRTVRGVPVMGYLQVSDAALRRERLLQLSMMLFPRDRTDYVRRELNERQERAFHAVERLHGSFVRREAPTVGDLRQALRGVDGVARGALNWAQPSGAHINHGGWSKGLGKDHPYDRFEIIHVVEQPPHRDNRVYLSDGVDELGCRKIAIDWRWHDEDIANTMRAQDLYAAAIERSGLGRLEIPRPEGRLKMRSLSTSHYMGMTRMHADPRQGVVDARCEVHGVRNLFIASSSARNSRSGATPGRPRCE
jgi:choline dehydrogenase-like flavoprotein